MSHFGVMVMGPAGVGKSTFCANLITHLQMNRRSAFYVNLDPAAEHFQHQPDLDIKDLISVEDVMDELKLGPNGGLVYCFEYLMENGLDWLTESLDSLTEEYLVIFDMPGQIELYTHIPFLPKLVRFLTQPGSLGFRLCAAYLLDASYVLDRAKYFAGTLSAMSAMLLLELPAINILSKVDMVQDLVRKKDLKRFITPDRSLLDDDPADAARMRSGANMDVDDSDPNDKDAIMSGATFKRLNAAVANLIEEFSMVTFLKLSSFDEESVGLILAHVDDRIQYWESQEPREPPEEEFEE
ncbi:hypothetical protein VTK56DRAFT_9618 [Thermocarpiscus australiensis]